jgi:hypothetical protein
VIYKNVAIWNDNSPSEGNRWKPVYWMLKLPKVMYMYINDDRSFIQRFSVKTTSNLAVQANILVMSGAEVQHLSVFFSLEYFK